MVGRAGEVHEQHRVGALHDVGVRVDVVGDDDERLFVVLSVLNDQFSGVVHLRAVGDDHVRLLHIVHDGGVGAEGFLEGSERGLGGGGADVEVQALAEGQEVIVVLDQHGGLGLQLALHFDDFLIAGGHEALGIGDLPRLGDVLGAGGKRQGLGGVGVGVLEQAQFELGGEQAADGLEHALLGDQALLDGVFHGADVGGEAGVLHVVVGSRGADLVKAEVDGEGVALGDGQLLEDDAVHGGAGGVVKALRAPVGDDDAFVAQRLAQVVHGLGVVVNMHGVGEAGVVAVGHQPLGVGFQSDAPGGDPVVGGLRVGAGAGEVGVAAAGDPVLGAGIDAVFYLDGLDLSLGHGAGVLGVLAVPGADLLPVGMQHDVDAHGAGFPGVLLPELLAEFDVVGGAEGIVRGVDHAAPGVVLAVVGDGDRDAQAGLLTHLLHGVVVFNLLLRQTVGVVQEVGDAVDIDVVPHRMADAAGGVSAAAGAGAGSRFFFGAVSGAEGLLRPQEAGIGEIHTGGVAAGVGMDEHGGFLLQRHLAVQILDARVHIRAPVFVDVQFAVLVQILELEAVHLENGRSFDVAKLDLIPFGGDDVDLLGRVLGGLRGFLSERGEAQTGERQKERQQQGQFLHLQHPFLFWAKRAPPFAFFTV